MSKALAIRVTGRVQGVGFRAWTRDQATRLGLTGWVRNEADGSVSMAIAGDEASVTRMVEHLHDGPTFAKVDSVEAKDTEMPAGGDFRIEH